MGIVQAHKDTIGCIGLMVAARARTQPHNQTCDILYSNLLAAPMAITTCIDTRAEVMHTMSCICCLDHPLVLTTKAKFAQLSRCFDNNSNNNNCPLYS